MEQKTDYNWNLLYYTQWIVVMRHIGSIFIKDEPIYIVKTQLLVVRTQLLVRKYTTFRNKVTLHL